MKGQLEQTGRVVVVHGPADATLEQILRSGGLVPLLEVDTAVVWGPPAPEVAPAEPAQGKRLLLTIAEAAEMLALGRSTVYELIGRGDLEVVHVGRSTRVPADAVQTLIDRLRSGGTRRAGQQAVG